MNGLGALDWTVLVAYLVVVGGLGVAASRRVRTESELNLAGRSMPAWAVSISILATSLSAVTFIGAPQDAYSGNLTYLSLSLGSVIGACVVALTFLPRYYKANVSTVYEILEQTGSPTARRACAGAFLAGRMLASGARLYIVAIPCALILFGRVDLSTLAPSIALLTTAALVYTAMGGIRAVIWTDTLQAAVFVFAAGVSIWLLLDRIPLSAANIVNELQASGDKLRVFDMSTSLDKPYTLWSALIGFSLLNIAAFATDQDLAQRMLTCKSSTKAAGSLIASSIIGIGMTGVFLVIGLLLFVAHKTGAIDNAAPTDTRRVFVDFILNDAPVGIRGIMLAGIFAAAMSSLDSALNAMATSYRLDFQCSGTGHHTLRRARRTSILFGALLAAVAIGCAAWQQGGEDGLIPFALGVMVFAYAGLLGVFSAVLFAGRGSASSIIAAMTLAAVTVGALQWLPEWWPGESVVRPSLGWRMTAGTVVSFVITMTGKHTSNHRNA